MDNLSTRYNPKEVEDKWFELWSKNNCFHQEKDETKKPYCIVIPPPNVTGILHMGHALNNTLQDILVRRKRMQGYAALWVPGTDHAGIATQNVVERALAKEGKTRHDIGREEFIKRAWYWTKTHGGTIIKQLKKLGCSCDWARERFTLDEGYSAAVNEVFIKLYKDDLVYKGSYIINWCPRCQSALSDEEAPHKELQGNLYHIKYPLKDSSDFVTVATTRPETMFGDTALAVNPNDKRYKDLIGKTAILPIANREIEIISDEFVDPEFGTGIVKVTPLHDPNDYDMGCRHKLEGILCINPDGTMNANATEVYDGLDRFEAREALIEDLKERKLLGKIEAHVHAVGHCYRCHTIIEPYFSEQWFVRMKPLAQPALKEATEGNIRFSPQRWYKIYDNWMQNIRDWCISRQIWWGHRIPAWYCSSCFEKYTQSKNSLRVALPVEFSYEEMGIIAVGEKPNKCSKCGCTDIFQDADVLDTWFSSWLWPFAVFGWPQKSEDLQYFYPTQTLVTASEIIFFWVARMIMSGLKFLKNIPFSNVYIHGTVRDDKGRKMSKSLGNAIDPLEVIEKYGADALRFSLISLPGEDLYLSENKFEFGRNLMNKLWNASRFILMNIEKDKITNYKTEELINKVIESESNIAEKWILAELFEAIKNIDESIDSFRFHEASSRLYDFFWHKLCDWYIELAKINIEDELTQNTLYFVLKSSLKLFHPFVPFATEEIWQKLPLKDSEFIMLSEWPVTCVTSQINWDMSSFDDMMGLIGAIRNKRAQFKIAPTVFLPEVIVISKESNLLDDFNALNEYFRQLGKIEKMSFVNKDKPAPKSCSVVVYKAIKAYILLEGLVDVGKESARLSKEIGAVEREIKNIQRRLENKGFLNKAPKDVVDEQKQRLDDYMLKLNELKAALKEIS
jgi:valyl-tRNA synthetase